MAEPIITENWMTYPVDATTAEGILMQMQERGPNGLWGYATWYVRWNASCEVSLELNYTMPEHQNPSALPEALRMRWEEMVAALGRHEEQHGMHGVNAAREILEQSCLGANPIIAKWEEKDRILDQQTDHGKKEGVVFP